MNNHDLILNLRSQVNDAKVNKFDLIEHTNKHTVFSYKFQPLIDADSITVRPEAKEYSMFSMYLLESLSILSAYVFYIPGYYVDIHDYYVKIIRQTARDLKQFKGVKMIMQDNKLNIYHSDDGATLISVNGLKDVIKPSMIRKSEKTREEDNK